MSGPARAVKNVFSPPKPDRGLDDVIRGQQQAQERQRKALQQQEKEAELEAKQRKESRRRRTSSGAGGTILTGSLGAAGYGSEQNVRRRTLLGG